MKCNRKTLLLQFPCKKKKRSWREHYTYAYIYVWVGYQKVQEGNFKCPQCPTKQTFNTVSTFRKHLIDHENENYGRKDLDNVAKKHKETFLCSYANCGQFSKFEKLQEHLLFHERAGNKELYNSKGMLNCDLCGWTIIKSDPIRLLKHLFYEHSEHTTTSDFMCETVSYTHLTLPTKA